MPDIVDNDIQGRGLSQHRSSLINSTDGVDLETSKGTFRIANVPLFREIDGALHQAVRVWVPVPFQADPLTFRISDGSGTLGEGELITERQASSFCLVPEVDADREVSVEIVRGDKVIGSTPFTITPQRKWTVHLVQHSHYDIGYTDPQATVLDAQLAFLDNALELADLTEDWPEAAQFRWNVEVNWPLRHWLRTRPQSARDALVRRIKEGRIEVHALPFSMHSEAYSYDELAQQLTYAQELRETLGIEIVSAMQTDVPGHTIGLSSLLTDAGIKYFCVSHNYAGRSIPHMLDGQQQTRPFRWAAPDGEELLVWYGDTLHGYAYMEGQLIGFGAGVNNVEASLPEYLNAVSQNAYPYTDLVEFHDTPLTRQPYEFDVLHLRVMGDYADNGPASIIPSEIVREFSERWSWPKVRTSTDRAFFEDLETRIADRHDIPTYHGDWTDWWADGIGSGAFALGKNRQSQDAIKTAQTLHAIADAALDAPKPVIAEEVKAAYQDMALFDEHTWGAANPWDQEQTSTESGDYQWQRKIGFAWTAEERVTTLLSGGLQRFAGIGAGTGEPHVAVFNPSSWTRSDIVNLFIPETTINAGPFRLVDLSTGTSVPYKLTTVKQPEHRIRGQLMEFIARDTPPVGYAMYAIEPGEPAALELNGSVDQSAIRNETFELAFDFPQPTPVSLKDLATGGELIADKTRFGFNDYIYDRYTSAAKFNHLSSSIRKIGSWMLGSRKSGQHGFVLNREHNALWDRVTVRYAGDGCDWLESTYTLPAGIPRLDIANRYFKPSTLNKESVYWAFPFAGSGEFSFEITGGIVGPADEHVPGSAQHFRAMRHWATLNRGDGEPLAWATREAALIQVGNIHLPYQPFPTSIADDVAHPSTLYSWALNNIWDTNFPPQQGGEFTNHYSMGIGKGESELALGRSIGAAVASPLGAVRVSGPTAEPKGSFVIVDDERVQINHLSSKADGKVTILLENQGHEPVETEVSVPRFNVSSAETATFLGTNPEPVVWSENSAQVTVKPGELRALILTLA